MDNQFTLHLQNWLNTPAEQRNLLDGALMLFQLDRNRAQYNTILRRPEHYARRLETKLRKHLRIRLDGLTMSDLTDFETTEWPPVSAQLSAESQDYQNAREAAISALGENPSPEQRAAAEKGVQARGRRPDHDQLPPEIRALYDDNGPRYQKMRLLYETLLRLSDQEPCDRYEYLKLLVEADKTYRKNLADYDAYRSTAPAPTTEDGDDFDDSEIYAALTGLNQSTAAPTTAPTADSAAAPAADNASTGTSTEAKDAQPAADSAAEGTSEGAPAQSSEAYSAAEGNAGKNRRR